MLLLAKIGIGIGATSACASAWVFHEGVIRVDVDECQPGGSHVHVWVPATTVSVGLRLAPRRYLRHAAQQSRQCLPAIREIAKELEKYPNAELVDVRNSTDHVRVFMRNGRLYVDATTPTDNVHVSFPTATLRDVADRLEEAAPTI